MHCIVLHCIVLHCIALPKEAPEGPRRPQEAPGGRRRPQEPPRSPRRAQERPRSTQKQPRHKKSKTCHKWTPGGPRVPKRPQSNNRYKTAVKVHVAHTLWTRVRATVVFPKMFLEKRLWLKHVCKVWRFESTLLSLAGVLQWFLKALQNRSEKVKSVFWSPKKCVLHCFYCCFRSAHTKSTIELH